MVVELGRGPIRDEVVRSNGASHINPGPHEIVSSPAMAENTELAELRGKVASITAEIYSGFGRKLVDSTLMRKVSEEHAGLPAQVLVYLLKMQGGMKPFDIMDRIGVVDKTYTKWLNIYLDPGLTQRIDHAWQDENNRAVLQAAMSLPPRPEEKRWPFYYQYHDKVAGSPSTKVKEMYDGIGEALGNRPFEALAELRAKHNRFELSMMFRRDVSMIDNWLQELGMLEASGRLNK